MMPSTLQRPMATGFSQSGPAYAPRGILRRPDGKARPPQKSPIEVTERMDPAAMASFFLHDTKRPFPKIELLKTYQKRPPTKESLSSRIATLKIRHEDQLKALESNQAYEMAQLVGDLKHSMLLQDRLPSAELVEAEPPVQRINAAERLKMESKHNSQRAHVVDLFRMRLLHIAKLLDALTKTEHLIREAQARQFPKTREEFGKLRRDRKLPVARYLAAMTEQQRRAIMMENQPDWTQEAANLLWKAWADSVPFRLEVQALIDDAKSSDPRRRPTT